MHNLQNITETNIKYINNDYNYTDTNYNNSDYGHNILFNNIDNSNINKNNLYKKHFDKSYLSSQTSLTDFFSNQITSASTDFFSNQIKSASTSLANDSFKRIFSKTSILSKESTLSRVSSNQAFEPILFPQTIPSDDTEISQKNDPRKNWKVWKFGGTSMGSADRIINVANLISEEIKKETDLAVVVSAVAGVTSSLQKCCDLACNYHSQDNKDIMTNYDDFQENMANINILKHNKELEKIKCIHIDIINNLLEKGLVTQLEMKIFVDRLNTDIASVEAILSAIALSGKKTKDLNDFVIGQGELWSSHLLFACLPSILKDNGIVSHSTPLQNLYISSKKPSDDSLTEINFETTQNTSLDEIDTYINLADTRKFLVVHDRSDPETAYWSNNYSKDQVFLDWVSSSLLLNSYLTSSFPNQNKFQEFNNSCISNDENKNLKIDYSSNKQFPLQKECSYLMIMTGFICRYSDGSMTNFSRNGSDYSASIISTLLKSKELTIWSDVDGVYSADPRIIPDAVFLTQLSYKEALELSYFGSKVLHSFSILPCIQNSIPIYLRSSFLPHSRGSVISSKTQTKLLDGRSIEGCKAFSMINDVSLINLEGTHMLGVPGIAAKLFTALYSCTCSVILISQGSSEHSICIAIHSNNLKAALLSINTAFHVELLITETMSLYYLNDCTILSSIGEGLSDTSITLTKLSNALSTASINIKVVSQGPSQHNISFVVHKDDGIRGLRALHNSIYGSKNCDYLFNSNKDVMSSDMYLKNKYKMLKEKNNFEDFNFVSNKNIDTNLNLIINNESENKNSKNFDKRQVFKNESKYHKKHNCSYFIAPNFQKIRLGAKEK